MDYLVKLLIEQNLNVLAVLEQINDKLDVVEELYNKVTEIEFQLTSINEEIQLHNGNEKDE